MRHVTLRALDMVRRRIDRPDPGVVDCVAACGGTLNWHETNISFAAREARQVVQNKPYDYDRYWPSCDRCRVLLDAALEQRDVAALLRAVANE